MKKYIFIALAAAGTMACSKLTPVDSIPVTELPEDEKTETVAPKEGETITIQLAQTKVTLNETVYVFEGNEQIVVKAASGPVATLSNSTEDPTTFTGVFETPLGKESDIFDFYYNYTDASGKASYVQNGQPWLEHKGVEATRAKHGVNAYVVEGVQLRQPKDYVALAITSAYDCTVDFHTLTTALPTGETTISGIQLGSGSKKPYFVNITNRMKGGFYLTVTNPEGQKMYTSYGTTTTISKNTTIKIKDFTPLSITGELSGFNTSYSIYTDSSNTNKVADANSVSNDYMSGGKLKISVQGISNSLLSLVSLDSITITSSDRQTLGSSKDQPKGSNNEYTWDFNAESSHTTWGELTITATAVFNTPAGQVTAEVPALSRHITGLPYTLTPDKDHWSAKKLSNYISFNNTYIEIKGNMVTPHPLIESSPHFHIPGSIDVNAKFNYSLKSGNFYKSVLKMYIGGVNTMSHTGAKGTTEITDKNVTGTLKASCPYIEFEGITDGASSMDGVYSRVYTVELKYK